MADRPTALLQRSVPAGPASMPLGVKALALTMEEGVASRLLEAMRRASRAGAAPASRPPEATASKGVTASLPLRAPGVAG